jgi:hypothetical protein
LQKKRPRLAAPIGRDNRKLHFINIWKKDDADLEDGDLKYFDEWFRGFCRSYYRSERREQMNILLKEKHSRLVAENALLIANGEAFGTGEMTLAEIAGLFHDIGRFPQYAQYKTFVDSASVNHGRLGAETLSAEGVLSRLCRKEQDIIINAVGFHNAFAVPDSFDRDTALVTKVVRDSDKLDIWRVFCEYYEGPEDERADAAPLGLPDSPYWSKEAVASIMKKETAKLAHAETLNDLKLLQLSWAFDLNFKSSFRLALERDIVRRMAATLPAADELSEIVSAVQAYVRKMAA